MARTPTRRNITAADTREMTVDDYIKEYQKAVDEANKRNAAKLAVYLKEVDEKRLSDDVEERSRQIEALEKYKKILESQGRKLDEKEQSKIFEKLAKEKIARDLKAQLELYKSQRDLDKEIEEYRLEMRKETNRQILESEDSSFSEKLKALGDNLKINLTEGLNSWVKNLNNSFTQFTGQLDNVISSYASYQTAVNARLQGTNKTFKSIENLLSGAVGTSPYIRTQTMLENVSNLVSQGIAYNVEQRAFLATIADNIATTFDASNSALLRIVRIQQSDSTAARLGLEAKLTELFNSFYSNTEYLSNKFDETASAILEASSTMTNEQAVAFEYQVQKWLGAMYSLGFSDTTISNLADAVGLLGSGNISALSDSPINNLLVMAATRIGENYADILAEGLDASTTNKLLQSVVEYVKEIAQSSSNQVVRSQFAEVFGLSISDLTAALHLNTDMLAKETMTYMDTIAELSDQVTMMGSRMNLSTMLENVFSNLVYGLGTNIAQSPSLYSIWKIAGLFKQNDVELNIPFVSALGSGVDLNTTVENLVKLGVVGFSTLGMIGDIVAGIGSTVNPAGMLTDLGISGSAGTNTDAIGVLYEQLRRTGISRRGTGLSSGAGLATSVSMVTSSSGEDFASQAKMSAMTQANEEMQGNETADKLQQTLDDIKLSVTSSATYDEKQSEIINTLISDVSDIRRMITSVVNGTSSFAIRSVGFPMFDSSEATI